jgi:CHAT domain-containing protein
MHRLICFIVVFALVAGCGAKAPPVPSAADRKLTLEAELAGIPAGRGATTAIRRAAILRALGRQDDALGELDGALEAERSELDWAAMASLWRAIADVHLEVGRTEQALDVFGKRLEAAVSLGETTTRATALVDTAYAFALLGRVGQADEAVTEARVLAGDALESDPLTVERLGLVADLLQDSDKARALLERAAEGYQRAGDGPSATRAAVLAAYLAARDGGDNQALMRLESQAQGLADAAPLALLRRFGAEMELLEHDYDGCIRKASEAVTLADGRGLHPVAKLSRVIAARCADETGQLDDAIRYAREAGDLVEVELQHTTGEAARQELGFEAFQIYRVLLTLEAKKEGPDRVDRAFVVSERARARAHLDAVARSQLGPAVLPVSPALARDKSEAEARIRRLTQALLQSRARDVAERHQNALWALEDIKESIARSNPLLSRITPPAPADVATAREHLVPDGTLLLSYFMTDEKIYLFAVDDRATLDVLDASSEDVDAAVRRFRSQALLKSSAPLGQVKGEAQKLFELLMGKVAPRLAGKTALVVVPHGSLSSLPFESLVGRDQRFLVESLEVSYALSATLAVALEKRPHNPAPRAFVGMGDPIYDWGSFSGGRPEGTAVAMRGLELWSAADEPDAAQGLERLPGTARELSAIARLFGRDQRIYLRAEATEEVVKNGAFAGYRIVHVASHGLMAPHYQALALTLKPDATEDGFLMNSELAELDLNADLVVLSACRTGDTRQRAGEPVAGLALSLRNAGARRVVLSLWSVDDDATADLMVKFYGPLAKGEAAYRQSLTAAKRAMIEGRWPHPFYWAAFVLHGR